MIINYKGESDEKKIAAMLALVLAAMALTGCGVGMTDEEKAAKEEANRLAAMEKEEAATGVRRLNSVNLEDCEIVLRDFVAGLQEDDPQKVANAIGAPNVFADSLYGWILKNGYESLKDTPLEDIKVATERTGAEAVLNVMIATDDPEAGIEYRAVYEGGKWVLKPPSGVEVNFEFIAPTKHISCHGKSLAKYAVSTTMDGSWLFVIPYMPAVEESAAYSIESNLGTFEGKLFRLQKKNILLACFDEEQKDEFAGYATAAFNNIFGMLKAGADKNEVAAVLLSESTINGCFPSTGLEDLKEKWQTVTRVAMKEDDIQNGYPNEYTYRLAGEDSIILNVKLQISTSVGDSRKRAAITMQNIGGVWKVVDVTTKDNVNPFTSFEAYNPAW